MSAVFSCHDLLVCCFSSLQKLTTTGWSSLTPTSRRRWETLKLSRSAFEVFQPCAAWVRWRAAGINPRFICNLDVVAPQVTEEMMEQANEKKMDAVNALGEGVSTLSQILKLHAFSFWFANYLVFNFKKRYLILFLSFRKPPESFGSFHWSHQDEPPSGRPVCQTRKVRLSIPPLYYQPQ